MSVSVWPAVRSRRGYNYPDYDPGVHRFTILPPLILVDGNLTPDPKADCVLLANEVTISRIDVSAWLTKQAHLWLLFQNKGHVLNKIANSGTFYGLALGDSGGLSDQKTAQLDLGSNATIGFILDDTGWILDNAGIA